LVKQVQAKVGVVVDGNFGAKTEANSGLGHSE